MGRIIALLQLDPTVGDVEGNIAEIEAAARLAAENGASLAITSELAVSGYPPRDLLLQPQFVSRCAGAAESIESSIPMIVGTPLPPVGERHRPGNGAIRIVPGRRSAIATRKQLLPTYDVFDEGRYFEPDDNPGILRQVNGMGIGVTICEDAWQHAGIVPLDYGTDPIEQLANWEHQGEPLAATINLSSSPYHLHKEDTRAGVARICAKTLEHPFLLCNQVGGNDDLLFDGRSLAAWPDGTLVQAPGWCMGLLLIDIDNPAAARWIPYPDGECENCECSVQVVSPDAEPKIQSAGDDLLCALTTGLRDYCRKSGMERIVLGMSGGIDSSVAAAVACRALGADNVVGLSMPSRYSSDHSIADAKSTAEALEMRLEVLSLEEIHTVTEDLLGETLTKGEPVAAENIQARLRGLLIMAHANAAGAMAIATGNKSELAQGYCTLYGDMVGGYAPLGDLWKSEVYAVAETLNAKAKSAGRTPPITRSTLTKPPSAELAPNQLDVDTLPPYDELDRILQGHIEEGLSAEELVAAGEDAKTVSEVLKRLYANEHKRWQMAPSARVSRRAFGQGWRQPLAARINGS
jgi:NAD+ synthetase